MRTAGQNLIWTMMLVLAAGLGAAGEPDGGSDNSGPDGAIAGFDWSEYVQGPIDNDPEMIATFTTFVEAMAAESRQEAEIAAKQMVEVANLGQDDGINRARALHNLAVAQQAGGNYESAKQNYLASIDAIASGSNNLSPELVMPLRGLAAAFLETEQPDAAFAALDRAMHVSSVNYGPHSDRQLAILNMQLGYYVGINDVPSAVDVLDRIDGLYRRAHDRLSAKLLPMYYQQADVFLRLGLYAEEREAWRRILAIKSYLYAENDPQLIEPNIRLAGNLVRVLRKNSFRSVSTSMAERHLKEALWIAEHSPDNDWAVRRDCLLSLADFYTLFDMKGRARRYYSKAWELLSSDGAFLAARDDAFASPLPISRYAPDPYASFQRTTDSEAAEQNRFTEGELTVQFDVDDEGRARNVRVVEADPQHFTLMEKRARNAVGEFIYRPRYVNGRPVETPDLQYRFRYYYRTSDYEASVEKSAGRRKSG